MYLIIWVFFDTSNYWIFLFNIYLLNYLLYLIAWQNWIKSLNCFFFSIVPYKYKLYLYFNVGRKNQQKLLDNNEWLKGIKKDLEKKKQQQQQQQKPTTNLFLDSFRMKQGTRKPEIHN